MHHYVQSYMNIPPSELAQLHISVVICTYNRGALIINALHSILKNTYPSFEVLIFDQSTNDETQKTITFAFNDSRIRYVRSNTIGLGLARDMSLALVTSDIVLMTDDDCEVAPDWIAQMAAVHTCHPKAAVIFCDVRPGPHDKKKGFIPHTFASRDRLITTLGGWCGAGAANVGIGAGLGVRRSLVTQLGGFDSRLGAGTALRCAEETDLAVRALLHGHHVYRTTATYVVHHGFRTFEEGRTLMQGYMLGIAAAYTKLLRCGYMQLVLVLLYEFWRTVLKPSAKNLLHLRVPPVLGRITFLIKGFAIAWQIPLDRKRELFEPLSVVEPVIMHSTLTESRRS